MVDSIRRGATHMRKVIFVVLFALMVPAVPTVSDALTVTISNGVNPDVILTLVTTINGKPSISIEGITVGNFSIATCTKLEGCSGFPARVFVDDGNTIDNLALTDAKITAAAGGNLTISFHTDTTFLEGGGVVSDLSSIPPGTYPYAAAVNGAFLGAGARTNAISVVATTPSGFPNSIGTLLAPAFSSILSAAFTKQATSSAACGSDVEGIFPCFPSLSTQMVLTFPATGTVRLPGSVHVLVANKTVENGGFGILAKALDDLMPGVGPKIYDVNLEPSPGSGGVNPPIMVRNVPNTSDAWVVQLGGHGESLTEAQIRADGIVDVTARGLCPSTGCLPMEVKAAVFCGDGVVSVVPLSLDQKGSGMAEAVAPVPCADPAVLITDSGSFPGAHWIAAPALF